MSDKIAVSEHLLGITILVAFLMPHTSPALMMLNPLLWVLLKIYCGGKHPTTWQYLLCAGLLVTLLIGLVEGVSNKSVIRFFTIVCYFALFPCVGTVRVRPAYLNICLTAIVVSQLTYLLNIPILTDFLDQLYPIGADDEHSIDYMRSSINASNYFSFRMGGLYRNANHCAKLLCFLMAFYSVINPYRPLKSQMIFLLIAYYAVFLTGSRTGFVTSSFIVLLFVHNRKDINRYLKCAIWISAIIAMTVILGSGSDRYRAMNVQAGLDNSLAAKLNVLHWYLSSETNIFKLLFGWLDSSRLETPGMMMTHFDGELGDLIFSYGFLGTIAVFGFLVTVFKKIDKRQRMFFVVLLWMISSTIICSYRASFAFMLLLSVIYSSSNRWRMVRVTQEVGVDDTSSLNSPVKKKNM